MNILFLTQVLPFPLVGGAKIRAYYVLRQLALEHRITLVSFTREDDSQENIAHLEQFCKSVLTVPMVRSRRKDGLAFLESLLTRKPTVIIRDRLPAMQYLLKRVVNSERFHVIHADQTSMAQYGIFAQNAVENGPRPATVLDQHNALYLVVNRQAGYETGLIRKVWQREANRLKDFEISLCRHFDRILTVTEEDKAALLSLLAPAEAQIIGEKLTAIPICVDPDERRPVPHQNNGPRILHLGTMFWPPNVEGVIWFCQAVLPKIVQRIPEIRFIIAGKNPPDNVRQLANLDTPLGVNIEVTGFVPDPESLLASSSVFVVPVRAGGGMRVKIVDAWMHALPVVSTMIGAEGINVHPGENILLADEADDFAAAVIRVLTDDKMASRLRQNGRRSVEDFYNWRKVYIRVSDIYNRLEQESSG